MDCDVLDLSRASFHAMGINLCMIYAFCARPKSITCYQFKSKKMISSFRLMRLAVVTVGALACMAPVLAATPSRVGWTGVVTYVVDGDTVHVRPEDGGKPVKIRIEGIDAPEICQAGGTAARDALKRQVLGQRVVVQSKTGDVYGRLVARIVMNQQDQGRSLVAQGLAWSYRYQGSAGPYAVQQCQAQSARLGMFARADATAPVYPAEFRKKHGSCYAKYR